MSRLNFSEHNARVQAYALRAFRVRKRTKNALSIVPVIAGAVLISWFGLNRAPSSPTLQRVEAIAPAKSESPKPSHLLSDEQLINMFPPGSCFLAEVNGQKILVFNEP